jgi:hypothetical protein
MDKIKTFSIRIIDNPKGTWSRGYLFLVEELNNQPNAYFGKERWWAAKYFYKRDKDGGVIFSVEARSAIKDN